MGKEETKREQQQQQKQNQNQQNAQTKRGLQTVAYKNPAPKRKSQKEKETKQSSKKNKEVVAYVKSHGQAVGMAEELHKTCVQPPASNRLRTTTNHKTCSPPQNHQNTNDKPPHRPKPKLPGTPNRTTLSQHTDEHTKPPCRQ